MQRLEVSGAVRPLYRSLGVKGLIFVKKKNLYNMTHQKPKTLDFSAFVEVKFIQN